MGIENRDYIRGSSGIPGYGSQSSFGGGGLTPVCKWLIIANVVVFVLQLAILRNPNLAELQTGQVSRVSVAQDWLELDPGKTVKSAQIWRLVTYAFCHDSSSPWHILFNMLFLWWFGKTLESMHGSREFLCFYLTAAVISGVFFVGLGMFLGQPNPAIGASGAVMAVLMLYAIYYPRHRIYLFFVIPVEMRYLVLFYVIYDLYPVLQEIGGAGFRDNVAHSAHLGGLAFGFLYWKQNIRLERFFNRFLMRTPRFDRMVGPRRKIRIYKPSVEHDLDEQVDAILEKIHKQGEPSLTDREREILKTASQKYKDR